MPVTLILHRVGPIYLSKDHYRCLPRNTPQLDAVPARDSFTSRYYSLCCLNCLRCHWASRIPIGQLPVSCMI